MRRVYLILVQLVGTLVEPSGLPGATGGLLYGLAY